MSEKSKKSENEQNLQAHLNRLIEPFNNLWEWLFNQAEREEMEMPLREHEMPLREFTADMKRDYTILVPQMLPVHFKLIGGILRRQGLQCGVFGKFRLQRDGARSAKRT